VVFRELGFNDGQGVLSMPIKVPYRTLIRLRLFAPAIAAPFPIGRILRQRIADGGKVLVTSPAPWTRPVTVALVDDFDPADFRFSD
jgi:hypothetical protein